MYDLDKDGKISRIDLLKVVVSRIVIITYVVHLLLWIFILQLNMTAETDWQVLRGMLEMQVTEEQLDSIVDRTIQEADLDGDDAISFEEFRKVSS